MLRRLCVLALLTWSVQAGATKPAAISFDETIGIASEQPGVLGARRAAERHRELSARISTLTGNPTLGLEPGYRFHPSEERGFEGAITVDVPWNLGGLSSRRRESARAEGDALFAQARLVALERRLDAARIWLALAGAEKEVRVVEEARALAETLAAQTARRMELGEATALDLSRARGLVATAKVESIDAEGRREELALALSGIVSDHPSETLATRGDLPHPELPTSDEWMKVPAFQRVPEARLHLLQALAHKARAAEVKAEAAGEIRIGVSALRESPNAFVGSVVASWTPALFDRGERARASEEAQAIVSESAATLAVQDARSLVAVAFHEVEHTQQRLKVLRDELVPNARETARLARELVTAGEETMTSVLFAQREAMEAERELATAESDHAWARIRLWLYLASLSAEGDGR